MRKSRFTETQIITILKAVEAGRIIKDICREYGISDAMYYNWKNKYSGVEASDIKRIKNMEADLSQLKRTYADLAFVSCSLSSVSSGMNEATSGFTRCVVSLNGRNIRRKGKQRLPNLSTTTDGTRSRKS